MATIKDVALEAGVSVQTVSNVLHGKSFVRPEIQSRVRAAIARLNYQPSLAAQSMRRGTSQTLGFLLSDPNPRGLADPFYGEVLAGIAEAARPHDFGVQIVWLPSDAEPQPEHVLRPFQSRRIDAAIVFVHGVGAAQSRVLEELVRAQALCAVLERVVPGETVYNVLAANYEGTYAATEHLIAAGHRRIVFLDSLQRWPSVEERRRGYRVAMQVAGLEAQIAGLESEDWTAAGGSRAVAVLARADAATRPTAIVAASDALAVGAVQALKAARLRVPHDVAVFGFDDFELARYIDPPLSTVRLPAFEMGRRAAALLLGHLHGSPAIERRVILPTELVIRGST
jgi:DNA-binding LacI/PurR family transcriptional regulator